MFRMVRARVPGIETVVLSAHCHDDLGLAVANTIASIQAGVRQVECAVNGIGERAGNASLEELAAILVTRHDQLPFRHNIVMNLLYPTSQMLATCISFGAAPNKAIVGANAFAHAAGIHQHGVMVNPLTYEIMTPESVGVPSTRSSSASTAVAARSNIATSNSATISPTKNSTPSTPYSLSSLTQEDYL